MIMKTYPFQDPNTSISGVWTGPGAPEAIPKGEGKPKMYAAAFDTGLGDFGLVLPCLSSPLPALALPSPAQTGGGGGERGEGRRLSKATPAIKPQPQTPQSVRLRMYQASMPTAQSIRSDTGPKHAPEARPGDRKHNLAT